MDNSDVSQPPAKKLKVTSQPKYDQIWKNEYSIQFKGIKHSEKGSTSAFCEFCRCHFSIRSGGSYDIKKHCQTQKHMNAARASASPSLTSFFDKAKTTDLTTTMAEVVFTKFLVEKNLPLAIADDAGDLFRTMFPSCEEVKKYAFARTKTTAILHELADHERKSTIDSGKESGVFSLSTDGGNDIKHKLFPIIVRYANNFQGKIVTEVLSVDSLPSSTATGKDIFDHLLRTVRGLGLSMQNCISFSADNASVMIGDKSGVAAFLHAENKNISIVGCPCHRINLAALKAANILPFKLDQLLIDIYFFLDKSSKRVARLKELQAILGTEGHEILKHVNTRWLSLGPCISRLLEQWEPLSALFLELSEEKASKSTSSKAEGILKKLLTSEVKAYALFLENIIKVFERANALLQTEAPLIQKLHAIMKSVVNELCLRFVKPSIIQNQDVLLIDVEKNTNLVEAFELDVGYKCKKFIEKELDGDMKAHFFKSVKGYFQTAVTYFQKKCKLDYAPILHAAIADPDSKFQASVTSLEFFVESFPSLLLLEDNTPMEEAMDQLCRQFREWQTTQLPLLGDESADIYWFRLSTMRSQTGSLRFHLLARCMLGVLSMFHSNAACERLFSMVRRNRTDFRSSMSNRLLESISILCKTKGGSKSSFRDPISKELLMKAKSATAASLKSKD